MGERSVTSTSNAKETAKRYARTALLAGVGALGVGTAVPQLANARPIRPHLTRAQELKQETKEVKQELMHGRITVDPSQVDYYQASTEVQKDVCGGHDDCRTFLSVTYHGDRFAIRQEGTTKASLKVAPEPDNIEAGDSGYTDYHCGATPTTSGKIHLNGNHQPVLDMTWIDNNTGAVSPSEEVIVGRTRPYSGAPEQADQETLRYCQQLLGQTAL